MTQAFSPHTTPSGKLRGAHCTTLSTLIPRSRLYSSVHTRRASVLLVRSPSTLHQPSCSTQYPLPRQQPNPVTQKNIAQHWTRLILTYARHKKLFVLRVEDADATGGEWDEVLRNPRINSGCCFDN